MYKYTREEEESLASNLDWLHIIPTEQAVNLGSTQAPNGAPATVWGVELGADRIVFATSPDMSQLWEVRPDSKGRPWSRFDALKHFKFAGDHNKTVQFLSSRFDLPDASLASIGRELVGERLRDALEIPPNERGKFDPEFADLVARNQYEMEARELAKERLRTSLLGREPESPEPVSLGDFLEQEEEVIDYLIDGLAGHGSTVIPFAQAKVGKTTFAFNMIRALADHELFLDFFPTREQAGKVGYMNYELNAGQCRRWFKDMDIRNVDKVVVWNLRGQSNPLRNRESLLEFAKASIAPIGIETLIIDPFSGAFTGSTMDNDEVKRFFLHLEDLKTAAAITNLVVIVHAGNDATRPRGATTFRDHPDALWSLSKDASGRRYFKAEGRDVAVDEGELLYEPATRRLTFAPSAGRSSSPHGLKEAIEKFIAANPGCKAKDVDSAIRASKERKATIRNELVLEGRIEVRDGGRNAKLFYPVASLPVVPESFREDGRLRVSSRSPLSIGGTTEEEGLTGLDSGSDWNDATGSTCREPDVEQDWPTLLRVAGW